MQGITGSTMTGGGLALSLYDGGSPVLLLVALVSIVLGGTLLTHGVIRRKHEASLAGLR